MSLLDWEPEELGLRLPHLPWRLSDMADVLPEDQWHHHWETLHRAYCDRTRLILRHGDARLAPMREREIEDALLVDVVRFAHASGHVDLRRQAAQAFNHAFFWKSLAPKSRRASPGVVLTGTAMGGALLAQGMTPHALADRLLTSAGQVFGSGWAWVVADHGGDVQVRQTHDEWTPLLDGATPLLCIDVWEHAWAGVHPRIDRPAYLRRIASALNWRWAARRYARAAGHLAA